MRKSLRAYAAEFTGSFILVLFEMVIGAILSAQDLFPVARGLIIFVLIFTFGEISGAHFNPAVTLAFMARGVFPWQKAFLYWLMQLSGCLCAVGLYLWSSFYTPLPDLSETSTVVGLDFGLTAFLILVILATSHEAAIIGPNSAFPVSGAVSLAAFMSLDVRQASINPVLALAQSIVDRSFRSFGFSIVAGCCGALIVIPLVRLIYGPPQKKEVKAAQGREAA